MRCSSRVSRSRCIRARRNFAIAISPNYGPTLRVDERVRHVDLQRAAEACAPRRTFAVAVARLGARATGRYQLSPPAPAATDGEPGQDRSHGVFLLRLSALQRVLSALDGLARQAEEGRRAAPRPGRLRAPAVDRPAARLLRARVRRRSAQARCRTVQRDSSTAAAAVR